MPNNECMERNLIDPIKKLAHHAAKFVRPPRITAFFQNLFARRIDLDEINTQDIVIMCVNQPSLQSKCIHPTIPALWDHQEQERVQYVQRLFNW